MAQRLFKAFGGTALAAVLVLGSAAPALAASHHRSHGKRHAANTTGSAETALTGTALSSASAAALAAVPGATVSSATTETDGGTTGAAYELHVTKSDGSKVLVTESSSFAVLSTAADSGCGGHGGSPGGSGG